MCAGHTARTQASNQKRGRCSSGEKRHVSGITGNKTLLHAASFQKCATALAPRFFGCVSACLPACHWLMEQQCLVRRKGRVRELQADQNDSEEKSGHCLVVWIIQSSRGAFEHVESVTRFSSCLSHPRCPSIASMHVKLIYTLKYFS